MKEVVGALEEVKLRLEELREERRSEVAEFRAQEAEWRREVERRREEVRRREDEERRRVAEEREREEREARAASEPFYTERALASLLLHYCSRLGAPSTPATPSAQPLLAPALLAVPLLAPRRRSSGFCSSTGSSLYCTPLEHTPSPPTPTCTSPPEPRGAFSRKSSLLPPEGEPALGKRGKREARRRRSRWVHG